MRRHLKGALHHSSNDNSKACNPRPDWLVGGKCEALGPMEILVIVAMCLFPLIVVGLVVFFILRARRPAK